MFNKKLINALESKVREWMLNHKERIIQNYKRINELNDDLNSVYDIVENLGEKVKKNEEQVVEMFVKLLNHFELELDENDNIVKTNVKIIPTPRKNNKRKSK